MVQLPSSIVHSFQQLNVEGIKLDTCSFRNLSTSLVSMPCATKFAINKTINDGKKFIKRQSSIEQLLVKRYILNVTRYILPKYTQPEYRVHFLNDLFVQLDYCESSSEPFLCIFSNQDACVICIRRINYKFHFAV